MVVPPLTVARVMGGTPNPRVPTPVTPSCKFLELTRNVSFKVWLKPALTPSSTLFEPLTLIPALLPPTKLLEPFMNWPAK